MKFNELKDKDKIDYLARCLSSYKYFCRNCLGMEDMNPIHDEVCDIIQGSGDKQLLILLPRHSFKSWVITQGYSLWSMIRDPEIRILIYSDSATKAEGFLEGIQQHIFGKATWKNHKGELHTTRFRESFIEYETSPHKGTWNDSQIVISRRRGGQIEPTIDTGGIDSSKVGKHYDLIIFDDIVSDVNTTTKQQMDKVHDCYKKSLSLLRPNGKVIITGTRWHYGDAYGRIIADNKEKDNFIIHRRDAMERKDGKLIFEDIGLNEEFLDYQRQEQGGYLFSCLYHNSPVDDEIALFKIDDFKYYVPNPLLHENMWITGACDPAGQGEDFTAITVVGTDSHMNMYVLDAVNQHLTPSQIIEWIIRLNYKWKFQRFGIERNYFKGRLEQDFRDAEKEHLKNPNYQQFSIKEDILATSKDTNRARVLRLQPKHEAGQIRLPNNSESFNTLSKVYSELAFQMIQFTINGPMSPHDDLVKCLSFHMELISKGGTVEENEPDWTTAVALERDYIEKLNRRNSSVPRAYRQEYEPSFN
jgi:hypothetical protein